MKAPNVLLICTDHWSRFHMGCAGHPVVMTPTVDQLARLGTRYTQASAAVPICIAARRSLMTGLSARSHGDRGYNERLELPPVPTLAQCFRDAGYQAHAVGKLHVFPQRARIGFDEVMLNEEGRRLPGMGADDWELFLADRGYGGLAYAGGAANNDYQVVPWHLPDECHQTTWSAREMCRAIHRRDPRKPGFWYLSFSAPHPPMWPLRSYLDLYRQIPVDEPVIGEWVENLRPWPYKLRQYKGGDAMRGARPHEVELARSAFYAMVTHIDHQIRVVLGTLREEGLMQDTIIAFMADHGEMLGDHGLWAKTYMYEGSIGIPLIVVPPASCKEAPRNSHDDRLAEVRDVMPTLLEMAGLPIPDSVEGHSLLGEERRPYLYGEHGGGGSLQATRMLRDERYKLIYYPEGNRFQLFDLREDPRELRDLAGCPVLGETLGRLKAELARQLYGGDEAWLRDGEWIGLPFHVEPPAPNIGLSGQKGIRFS